MRPILMTALTTILAMITMLFGDDMGSEMGKGMAIVVISGLIYATVMTLIVVPVLYDIFFRKKKMKISDSVSLSMDSGAAIRGASLPSLSRSTTKPSVTPGYTMRYCRYEAKSPSAVSTTMMLQHLPRRSSASKASCPSAVPIITSSRIISAARQTSSPKASSFRPPLMWTKRNS